MEKKGLSFSYSLLVIISFAVVCFLTDYIIIDRKLNESNGESITNNVNEGTNLKNNESVNELNVSILSSLSDYKSDRVDYIDLVLPTEFSDSEWKGEVVAYKNDKQVWDYSAFYNGNSQASSFEFIILINNKIYFQIDGNLVVLDAETGSKISQINDLKYCTNFVYANNKYVYITSAPAGSPLGDTPWYLSVIDINTNQLLNKISVIDDDRLYYYGIKDTNDSIITFEKINIESGEIIDTKSVNISELLNASFNVKSLF